MDAAQIEQFRQAAANSGIELPGDIVAGILQRFTVPGDRPKSDNGWYIYHPGNLAAGAFGCWKRQISETWCSKSYQTMTATEKASYTANMDAMKKAREAEQALVHAACRKWCSDTWPKAKDATNENPYLKNKGVNSYGLKCFKDSLLIPFRSLDGTIHGMQFIDPTGSKRFKTGTNKSGHFFKIGTSKDNTIIICEGYATGATIHQATGHAVVIAFDAGNLLSVSQAIRAKFPDIKIIIAADSDSVGVAKGTAAAKAVNGLLAIPAFQEVCHD